MMMKNYLAIEASSHICSVALSFNQQVYSRSSSEVRAHTQHLFAFIDELLQQAGATITDLDGVAFAAGPGSFTGVRLSAAVAKSLAYAAKLPVIGVSSLAVLAQQHFQTTAQSASVLVVVDARMDEYYVGEYQQNADGSLQALLADALLTPQQLAALDFSSQILLTDGSEFAEQANSWQLPSYSVTADARALLALAQYETALEDSALNTQVNYLRDKSGWKNLSEQKQNPVQAKL